MKRATLILLSLALFAGSTLAADGPARKLVQREEPEYPEVAARMSLHGAVKLRVWITADGSVRRLEYIGGHPLLAEAALRAVRNWKFEPVAKETTEIMEVKF